MTHVDDHERAMATALEAAAAARDEGNGAFGAVIVRSGEVVVGRNLEVTSVDPTAHAETVAIREAARVWGTRDLTGATMYASFEPCPMCCGAILASGIKTLVIGMPDETPGVTYTVERLLELTGDLPAFSIRRDVLVEACHSFYATVQ